MASSVGAAAVCLDASILSTEMKAKWDELGQNDGYLGCPVSHALGLPNGAPGSLVKFKYGMIVSKPGQSPSLFIIATRGESPLLAYVDHSPHTFTSVAAVSKSTGAFSAAIFRQANFRNLK
jgi:hypothetical protein